jgi:dTMP kinase
MLSRNGQFIVIDGTDGSGKTTQLELLAARLRQAGFRVEIADFPQYNSKSAGLVEEYLQGKYGSADEVGPHVASIFYAVDRFDASFKIRNWLQAGKIVLSNRYVTANMGHQGGKISNPLERKAYFDWLYKLEYELFNIPRPDLNIILHVPAEISQALAQNRKREDHVGKTHDIHESNLQHLKQAESTYLEIAEKFEGFSLISCTSDNQIKSRETIHELVWQEVELLIMRDPREPQMIEVERLTELAKLPTRGHATDAGLDFYALESAILSHGESKLIGTGIKMAIPRGFVGLLWDKSSISSLGIKTLGGVIDADYRGEIKIGLINLSGADYVVQAGQKIAQMIIQKVSLPKIKESIINNQTERGASAYGSTGLF